MCLHAGSPALAVASVKSWPCYHGCNGSIKASRHTAIMILKTPSVRFIFGLFKERIDLSFSGFNVW